jgi:hypothetical protein
MFGAPGAVAAEGGEAAEGGGGAAEGATAGLGAAPTQARRSAADERGCMRRKKRKPHALHSVLEPRGPGRHRGVTVRAHSPHFFMVAWTEGEARQGVEG